MNLSVLFCFALFCCFSFYRRVRITVKSDLLTKTGYTFHSGIQIDLLASGMARSEVLKW